MKARYFLIPAAAAILFSCAEATTEETNASAKRYIEAWIETHHPEAVQNRENGIWTISETPGTGALVSVENAPYLFVSYVRKSIDGTVSATNDEDLARQIGSYSISGYYGDVVWSTAEGAILKGLEDAVDGMRVGGSKTIVIPSWLMTFSRYPKESTYFKKSTGNTHTIYQFTVNDFTPDIKGWQGHRLQEYSDKYLGGIDSTAHTTDEGSYKFGFYWKSVKDPVFPEGTDADSFTMPKDTTVYINYTGRYLDGKVFDTNIEKVAKDAGLYSASTDYSPKAIRWAEQPTDLKMTTASDVETSSSSSSVITGFAYAIFKMRPYEKVITAFWSGLGYGDSGSGNIPGYCPLVFEIEMTDKP